MVLTSASVHDSQVAIPLMKMTSSKVDYLYDLMDSAYDAQPIYEVSRGLGHVPLIDKNPRGKEVLPMAPHEALRYNERTVVGAIQQPAQRRIWREECPGPGL